MLTTSTTDVQAVREGSQGGHKQALRRALTSASGKNFLTASQRELIREICDSPENRSLAPEQFLVGVKALLTDAANDSRIRFGGERDVLLARFVSAFIEEFYGCPSQEAGRSG